MGIDSKISINKYLLLNPIYIGSLILLIINDVFLKYTHPSFITGKLSDFTGVFCLATVCYFFLRPYLTKKISTRVSFSLSVGILAIAQIPVVIEQANIILLRFSLPILSITSDFTDLIVVLLFPLFRRYMLWCESKNSGQRIRSQFAFNFILSVSLLWFVATTFTSNKLLLVERGYNLNTSKNEFMKKVYSFLAQEEFKQIDDSFSYEAEEYIFISAIREENEFYSNGEKRSVDIFWRINIRFVSEDSLYVEDINLSAMNFKVDELADSLANKYFIPRFDLFLKNRH